MLKYLFIIIGVVLGVSCKTTTSPIIYEKINENIDKESQIIHLLINNNNFSKASESIEKNLTLYPGNLNILHLKGWLLLKQNKLKESEEIFLKVISKNNKYALAYAGLARINRINGNIDKAKLYIKKGLALLINIPILWLENGILDYKKKEYKKALANFNKAYNLNNKNTDAYFFKYITMLQLGKDFDEIKHYWKNILKNKSVKNWYFLYHATVLKKLGYKKLAKKIVNNGLTIFPNDSYLLNMTSNMLYEDFLNKRENDILQKAKEKILECIKNTKKLEPEFIDTYLSILEETKEKELLKEELKKYFLFFPNSQDLIKWQKKINKN